MRAGKKIVGCVLSVWVTAAGAASPGDDSLDGDTTPFRLEYGHDNDFSATLYRHYYSSRHGALSRHNGTPITEFSVRREFAGTALHYTHTQSERERRQFLGLSVGRAGVGFFNGSGDSFLKSGGALYPDLNHYFAHGGTRSAFEFTGAGVSYGFSGTLSAQFAGVRVTSPGVDARSAYYAGVSGRWFDAGYFHMERANDTAGRGFNLSAGGERLTLDFHQIGTTTDALMRRVGLNWTPDARSSVSLSYEDARNPLYTDGDDRRVMFRYRRTIGVAAVFNADEGDGTRGQNRKIGTVAGVGAGLAAAALFASSGDKSNDSFARFSSENAAGVSVLNGINPMSVAENVEYGGWVFRNADGTFGHTPPVKGDVSSVNIGSPASVPAGTAASASYHTHGGPDPRFVNNEFSPTDIASDIAVGVNGFLGTPQSCVTEDDSSGCAKKHIVSTGAVIILGPIAN